MKGSNCVSHLFHLGSCWYEVLSFCFKDRSDCFSVESKVAGLAAGLLCKEASAFPQLFGTVDIRRLCSTLPETNIAPETLGLEDEFPFGKASWQVQCLHLCEVQRIFSKSFHCKMQPQICYFSCFSCFS